MNRSACVLVSLVLASSACSFDSSRSTRTGEVDWDVRSLSNDERVLSLIYPVNLNCWESEPQVSVVESPNDVKISVLLSGGDSHSSCDTAFDNRELTVQLDDPIGNRLLLGCRPTDSVVLAPEGLGVEAGRGPTTRCPLP